MLSKCSISHINVKVPAISRIDSYSALSNVTKKHGLFFKGDLSLMEQDQGRRKLSHIREAR